MITRSKNKQLRKFKLSNINKTNMADNSENNGGSEVEFDVNNQMGETRGWEESTENESPMVSSETRGRREEEYVCQEKQQVQVHSETQQTPTNLDINMILQHITHQITESTRKK